ncbi:MAG: CDP-diacylglycerol--serine O-phosphatidyltransferase [Bacteroidales bacterium]|nr:CDP-diacylglycerol--serine O-phosphatidyltransferase [Bacteroidales bacterium]
MRRFIPNCITAMNLACGTAAIVCSFKGRVDIAFLLMLAAALFDFLDGLAARLLHSVSAMGRELDSLSDLVSFGLLPAMMLYNTARACMFGENILCWIPLLLAVFSGLRLAKFNVDERQRDAFLGLPTPACALLVGALCHYIACDPASFLAIWCAGPVFIPVLTLCLCALLVCEIPMFSMKFHRDDSATLKGKRLAFCFWMAAAAIICVAFRLPWSAAILLGFLFYIVKNIVYALLRI